MALLTTFIVHLCTSSVLLKLYRIGRIVKLHFWINPSMTYSHMALILKHNVRMMYF